MSKKKDKRERRKARYLDSLKAHGMKLDLVNLVRGKDANEISELLRRQGKDFLWSAEWRALRLEAIKLYGNRCAKCGKEDEHINIDHIKPRKFYPDLALDINNLQPLCHPCNKEKGNKAPVDYRNNLTRKEVTQ
jgi:5-methylcytosine-specific restriction endonuclease McrA